METFTTVSLHVPLGREDCVEWLTQQPPETIATLLETTRAVHTLVSSTAQNHSQDVQRALQELRPVLEAQCERKLDALREHHETELTLLNSKLAHSKHDVERILKDLDAAMDTNAKLQSERAIFQTSVRDENDARLSQIQSDSTERAQQQTTLYEQQVQHLKTLLDEERARNTALQEGPVTKMETLMASLCGSSQRRGEIGEQFVKQVHDGMELGVFTNNSHQRRPGIADGTWNYAPSHFPTPLTVLCEIKFAKAGDTTEDVEKFLRDLDVAARAKRINGALYLSLIGPIAGKKKLSLELIHGVPVLWASRSVNDDLSAWSLVELAFLSFASAWPMMHASSSTKSDGDMNDNSYLNDFIQQASVLLQTHLDEYAKLEPRIAFLERTSEQMRKEAVLLRKSRDNLASQTTAFQGRHAFALTGDGGVHGEGGHGFAYGGLEPNDVEEAVVHAIRTYTETRKKGYYPKTPDDLQKDLSPDILKILVARPTLFLTCERRVRAERQLNKKKGKKRKADNDCAKEGEE